VTLVKQNVYELPTSTSAELLSPQPISDNDIAFADDIQEMQTTQNFSFADKFSRPIYTVQFLG
jgi:hypothetical protein